MNRLIANALGLTAAFVALSGVAIAQSQTQAMNLMAGDTELVHSLDTKSAMPGQLVTVKLTDSIKTPDGIELPHGTELMGRVDQVKASEGKSPSKLVLTFSQARLKDGKTVPVKATLVGFAAAGGVGELPTTVAANASFDQEPGAMGDVALKSAVKQPVSGTLTNDHSNIKLGEGTQFLVAVGAPSSQSSAGAE